MWDKWTLHTVVERGALAFERRKCWHLAQLDVLELVATYRTDIRLDAEKSSCRKISSAVN
jgi:hypothetical protein